MNEETNNTTDWKAVALALGQRVNFAVMHCDCKGPGLLDIETGNITPWRDYMADGMEMIPGVKVDREIMHTMGLPKSKRKKAQEQIKANRAAEAVCAQGGAA